MKKTSKWFATLVGCVALTGLSALPAFAATGGDIYEIRPCDAYGYSSLTYGTTGSNKPIASQAAPITASGTDVYFKLRLLVDSYTVGSKKVADDKATFSLVDIYGREITDPEQFLLNPLKIGIYVGGRPDAAEMITLPTPTLVSYTGSTERSKTMWDIVFHYKVQAADLGLPIKLAVRSPDNPNGIPYPENYDAEGSLEPSDFSYQFYNDGYWKILYTPGEGRGEARDAVMLYIADGEPSYSIGEQPENDAGFKNRSLSECGFYTKTVDFSNGSEELVVKKGHNLGGSVEIAGGTTATSARELYVWAVDKAWYDAVTNDPATAVWKDKDSLSVRVKDSAPTQVIVGYDAKGDPVKQYVYMTKVTIVGGTSRGNFTVYGQNFAEGQDNESVLILSSAPSFTWKKGLPNTPLLQDFSTTTAKCEKSEPELTLRRSETSKLVYNVTSDYSERVTTLNLTLSEPYKDGAMTVTVTPKLVKESLKAKYTWDQIVRINTEQVEQGVVPAETPVTVTIPAGKTIEEMPIYLYGMGASADQNDWSDNKGNKIDFELKVEPQEAAEFLKDHILNDILYVVPDAPVLANAAAISEITVSSGEPEPVSMVVTDNYTDVTDTNTGYTVKALWWDDGEEPSDLKFRQNAFDLETAESGITTFKPDANGILTALKDGAMIADDLPAIPADVRGQNLRIRINAPNSAQTAYHDIRVSVVTKPKAEGHAYETKAGDYEPESFPEITEAGKAKSAYIGISLESPNKSGGDLYAFLKPKDEAQTNLVSGRCIITDGKASKGIRIRANESKEYSRAEISLLDGIEGGTLLEFEVVLCTKEPYSKDNVYLKYDTASPLEILVDNVAPEVSNISMSGWDIDPETKAFEGDATVGVDQYFTFKIRDAVRDLEATDEEAFQLTYQFKGCSPLYGTKVTYSGDPSKLIVSNQFAETGTAKLNVTLLDKDGDETGPLSYAIEVVDKPYITIANKDEITTFFEDETPEYQVRLSSNPARVDLTVALTIENQATGALKVGGDFKFKETTAAGDVYTCTYKKGDTLHSFYVTSADGTAGGASKFALTAAVTTDDAYVPGTETKWKDYFTAGRLSPVTVKNAKPTMTIDGRYCRAARDVSGESDDIIYLNSSNTPIQVAIGEAPEILWSANDVALDLEAGIKVTIVDAYGSHPYTFYDDTENPQKFTPSFKYAGPTTVSFTATDKDGDSIVVERFYTVKATRQLSIAAVGPSENGNGSPHASYYRGAGRGQGHVYANAKCTGAIGFNFDFNCGLAANVRATAQGYRVGDVDDGTLTKNGSMGDNAITPEGTLAPEGTPREKCFPYEGNRDSFFYVWVRDVQDEDGKFTSDIYGDVSPEVTMAASATFTLPTEVDKETGGYPVSQYEAIFSREFLWSDNIGDINADAIPDIYALGYKGFNVSGAAMTDMDNLSQFNEDEDYFPFVFNDAQASGIFMPAEDWVSNAKKFTARLEIRGWGDHLNDAYQVLNAQGYAGSIPEYKADKVYTDPAVDTNSTLTAVEYDAWVQAGKPEGWSPERPTDPTKADTDGDNMPDGFEYYIWYKAHVGWIDNGTHKYLTGRKYNPADPYDPIEITSATIAAAFDPLSNAGSDWDVRDTDDDGLTDYAEYILGTSAFDFDTDGDGLPDAYEIAITGTDPLDSDSNDNGIADGYENPDNDSMAAFNKKMLFVSVIGENGTEYYCCDGATLDDYTNVVDDVSHTGTRFRAGGFTFVTTLDWASSTYTNDNEEICLRPGFNTKKAWQCTTVGDKLVRVAEPLAGQLKAGTVATDIEEDAEFYDQHLKRTEGGKSGAWYEAFRYLPVVQGSESYSYGRGQAASPGEKPLLTRVERDILLMHYQVYHELGFHSATAWFHPPTQGSTNTTSYVNADEFLSMVFFHRTGALTKEEMIPPRSPNEIHDRDRVWVWRQYSTNPVSADTDGDSMPDGWEFYLMAKDATDNAHKLPKSVYSPLYDFRKIPDGPTRDNDFDLLEWPHEYSGTSSSARYGWTPLNPAWRNKSQPTDPWDRDTDADGVKDGDEGGYGTELNTYGGVVRSYFMFGTEGMAGGGLNPLTMDTDGDGLPDPWEIEYHGSYTPGGTTTSTTTSTTIGEDGSTNTVSETMITHSNCRWNMDGMNGTVADAYVDYDQDGLMNWQEYMVGTMRCWRYDDSTSSWTSPQVDVNELKEILQNPHTPEWDAYWYAHLEDSRNRLGRYNPNFANGYFDAGAAYFTCCTKDFDPCKGNWYYFHDGVNHWNYWYLEAVYYWVEQEKTPPYTQGTPQKYISCDPREADTDCDGMDDYYELFHGMNPLLGMPAVGHSAGSSAPYDVVYDAYLRSFLGPRSEDPGSISALNNWWRNTTEAHETVPGTGIKHADIGGYDFVAYPWLNGIASADPDGDNIVNQEEAIMPNVQAASTYHHTDPTPLWTTDSNYTNSLTRRFYRMKAPQGCADLSHWVMTNVTGDLTFKDPAGVVHNILDYPGFTYDDGELEFEYEIRDTFHVLNWLYSFEENEGYDSDHDYLSDYEEGQGKTKNASDPQVHDDPLRRQAMYFNGVDAFLETPVATREWDPDSPDTSTEARQNFLYYTVECWAKPDAESLKNDNQLRTLVERAIWADNASAADETLMRKNFLIGIKAGRWYTCFDSSGTDIQPVEINNGPVATTNWTHIAATYDGTALRLYVNGICNNIHTTSIQPEHGVAALALDKAGEMNPTGGTLALETDENGDKFIAILVGASATNQMGIVFDSTWRYRSYRYVSEENPEGLNPTNRTTFADYGNFYKGYIDEVRIWDGARSAADIQSDVDNRVRYTFDLAIENRQAVYNNWKIGGLRSPASNVQLPPQLMYHWAFDHIAGAILTNDVIQVPAGFDTAKSVLNAKARWSRPADYFEHGWAASDVRSTVYTDAAWVPWINNTVSHLPRFDLTTLDSTYWSEDYAGKVPANSYGYSEFQFPRNAEVYSRWTQMLCDVGTFYSIYLDPEMLVDPAHMLVLSYLITDRTRWDILTGYGTTTEGTKDYAAIQTPLALAYRFAIRDRNTCGDDILPMGGAYPRRISAAEGGMWDNLPSELPKAADAWAETGNDADNNGLPDWWEEYARQNYCEGLSPEDPLNWDTTVTYYGIKMPAYQAYLRDLANGMVKIGFVVKYDEAYEDTRDNDRDGLPDWWEEMYGLDTSIDNADDDADNDGLSNYQEYLLGEYYLKEFREQFKAKGIDVTTVNLSPVLAFSSAGQIVPDYFLRYSDKHEEFKTGNQSHFFANEYFGEIATDHDFMEDWWENLYGISYTNPKKYDPSFDKDGDGWSTYAECRASLWGGYFGVNLIDQWTGSLSDQYVPCRPQPIIGVKATYYGKQDISGHQLVVRTSSGQRQRMDATFVVPPTLEAQTKYIGSFAGDTILHGHLTPGQLNANSVMFDRARLSNEKVYTWNCDWYKENTPDAAGWEKSASILDNGWKPWSDCSSTHAGTFAEYKEEFAKWPMIRIDNADMVWESFVMNVPSADMLSAKLLIDGVTEFGAVDCVTGEFALDMSKFSGEGNADEYVYRATYTSRIGHEWPQMVYLSDTRELSGGTGDGYIREGKNTIEAFIDLNADGAYTPGEPYGVVQNVDVGWHKTPVTVIELKDTSHVVPRFDVATMTDDRSVIDGAAGGTSQSGESGEGAATGLTRTFTIKRVAINGSNQATTLNDVTMVVPKRTLMTKTLVLDSRPYLTEADVLGNAKFDLDSSWLVLDAEEKLGLKPSEIDNATYEISEVFTLADGTTSNVVLKTFVNTFNPQRVTPTAMAPIDQAPVYASSPTFTFASGDETMTAYQLQIRKAGTTWDEVVYDSGITLLPGRVPNTAGVAVYEVTPAIYANASVWSGVTKSHLCFADGETYEWRVALFNAKFNKIESEKDWSGKEVNGEIKWPTFQMDVANNNRYPYQATGYGSASIAVRYYGPTNATPDRIWVEAFENADFHGQPAARATLSDVTQLSDYYDIAHTNALVNGLAPGTYYFRAFIDFNGNGQRDDWESWGYNNYVGKGMKALYNPRPYVVTTATSDWKASGNADFTIFIEDCDTDQNEYPDCIDPYFDSGNAGTTAVDSDSDGIADSDEETYSTNPQLFDTDNDGMPDGYEAKFAETDPTLSDADECVTGDVMAFALREATLIVVSNESGRVTYMLEKDQPVPTRGDGAKDFVVRTTYTYPVSVEGKITEYYGVGTNLTLKAGTVVSVNTEGTVVLVHKQVYDEFGFNPKTCVADDDAVNTKEFTALDKYLVVRYREKAGLSDKTEAEVNASGTKAEDKWLWKSNTLKPYEIDNDADGIADGWELYTGLNPWKYDDARQLSKGLEGLTNLQEYDGGRYPTDPNNPDTDGDNVSDKYAYQYHLKGGDAGLDNDGDGLSNYAEYLISEVFKFAMLDPDNAKTDGSCVDYFRKVGDLYFGEVFTDHDQVNDTWEQNYNAFANRGVYDPDRDDDDDGWSNWAEAKAGTHPGTVTAPGVDGEVLEEYPIPTIAATVVYNGAKPLEGNLVFQAWNEGMDPKMQDAPDAAWVTSEATGATNVTKYVGLNPGKTTAYYLGTGAVSPGSLRVWFRDTAAENVTTYSNGYIAVSTATNPQWYYFVADSQTDNYAGDLLLCVTNMAAVKVGTVDYASGLVTIDFGSDALQQKVIDQWINGMNASGAAKSTGVASSAVQIDLSRSFVKLEWKPVNISSANGVATYYLSDCAGTPANWGRVREGKNKFVVFCDSVTVNNAWDPGEPFGFVQDVDIGWEGGAFTVELTDVSTVFARVNLLAAIGSPATDRECYQPGASAVLDLTATVPSEAEKAYRKKLEEIGADPLNVALTPGDGFTRIRVVRVFADGEYVLGKSAGATRDIQVPRRVVMDKYLNLNARGYLHEGDFLVNGAHDVGWFDLGKEVFERTDVYGPDGETLKYIDSTNITYMIVLGEGEIDAASTKTSNTVFRCIINKNYDTVAARLTGADTIMPRVDVTTPGIVYGAKPTFRWSMKNAEGTDFNSYTAFELQIRSGNTVLYTSGALDLPTARKDADGVTYEWTLDRSIEAIVGTSGTYTWRVAMYNAKFRNEKYRGDSIDLWSDDGSLVVDLNRQQPMNDHNYSSIAATVKYAGPVNVLTAGPKVRLQAYRTADFSGTPVAESLVTGLAELTNTAHVVSNACVHGIFQTGTYYLKAFIDSNGNGVQDDFESWGGAGEPVTIDDRTVTLPTVGIYIEDADTDGDWIPDAYEYAVANPKGEWSKIKSRLNGNVIGGDKIVFIGTIGGAVGDAGISTGLTGASLTIFQNQSFIKTTLGLTDVVSIDAIRAAVEKKVDPQAVKITALSLSPDGKTVTLSVAAEVTDSIAGELLGKVYNMTGLVGETVKVKIKVYRKPTLATVAWGEPVYTTTATVGKSDVQVDVPVGGIDMTSGFYKIEIEQQ